jgi:hypothetical protein
VSVYFEAAAVIVTLVLLGQMLEQRARSRTGAAIKALLGLAPKTVRKLFNRLDSVQLDMHSDVPLIKPDGSPSTAREWAEELGIFYAPSIVFFDEKGKEIIRVDSVVHFFRLRNVLNYVLSRGYLTEPNFLRWSSHTRRELEEIPPAPDY